jgi:hypothetical protein
MARTTKRRFRPNCQGVEGRQLLSTFYVVNASSPQPSVMGDVT